MPICCGKDRQTNFCPECGKPMDKTAGLRGLLRYVTEKYNGYAKKAEGEKKRYERSTSQATSNPYFTERAKEAKKAWERAQKNADQWRDWQECLIKAIDGE